MAFIFGGGTGGLFGSGGQQGFRVSSISAGLLQANYSAQLNRSSLSTLSQSDRAAFDLSGVSGDKVTTPWDTDNLNDLKGSPRSLDSRVRDIRELSKILDLNDSALNGVKNDPDRKATFALYKALDRLKTLAEYASKDSTIQSSLGRLDSIFQQGFSEINDFLASGTTNKLDLFLGDKEYQTESSTRLGKNNISQPLSGIAANTTDVITGLTGSEVFTVSLTKSGVTEDIQVDLSNMTGELNLANVKDFINQEIESVLLYDENNELMLDAEGNTQSKYLTRFSTELMSNGQYGLKIDGSLTEQVKFDAAVTEKALYVSGNVSQLDDDFAITSRLIEFSDIATTLTQDDVTSFASTDVDATAVKALTSVTDEEPLDPAIQKIRDQLRADALADATKNDPVTSSLDDTEDVDEEAGSITTVNSDSRVTADTISQKSIVDSVGNVYVVGHSSGSFEHQINVASEQDVFLSKFDSEGNLLFSRLMGVSDSASGYGLAVDSQDNVIISGQTNDAVVLQTSKSTDAGIIDGDIMAGSLDTFVAKFDSNGTEVFRYQLDSTKETTGLNIAVDSNDDIYVAGSTASAFRNSGTYGGGSTDGMLLKIDGATGTELSSTLIGGASSEKISQITIASDGNVLVAVEDAGVATLKKLDATDLSSEMFSIDLGTIGSSGNIGAIAVSGSQIVLSGTTNYASIDSGGTATLVGSASGKSDGFVASFTDSGASVAADFVTLLGTSETDTAAGVVIDAGKIYVAGTTGGDLNGELKTGNSDAYISRIDGTTGAIENTSLFGENIARMDVTSLAFTDKGNSVLGTLGIPQGSVKFDQQLDMETQTSARAGDNFYISIDGGRKQKIEINEGDTYDDIARRIRIAGLSKITVEVVSTSEGDKLRIKTLDPRNSPTFDILEGDTGRDALGRLGITAGRILAKNDALNIDLPGEEQLTGKDDVGGTFALGLDSALNISDKTTAKYVLGILEKSIATIQRAERSLTYNPLKELLKQNALNNAPPPPRITAQIANYQDALFRLQGMSQSGPASLFI